MGAKLDRLLRHLENPSDRCWRCEIGFALYSTGLCEECQRTVMSLGGVSSGFGNAPGFPLPSPFTASSPSNPTLTLGKPPSSTLFSHGALGPSLSHAWGGVCEWAIPEVLMKGPRFKALMVYTNSSPEGIPDILLRGVEGGSEFRFPGHTIRFISVSPKIESHPGWGCDQMVGALVEVWHANGTEVVVLNLSGHGVWGWCCEPVPEDWWTD